MYPETSLSFLSCLSLNNNMDNLKYTDVIPEGWMEKYKCSHCDGDGYKPNSLKPCVHCWASGVNFEGQEIIMKMRKEHKGAQFNPLVSPVENEQ